MLFFNAVDRRANHVVARQAKPVSPQNHRAHPLSSVNSVPSVVKMLFIQVCYRAA
jgi:hypothetical protein